MILIERLALEIISCDYQRAQPRHIFTFNISSRAYRATRRRLLIRRHVLTDNNTVYERFTLDDAEIEEIIGEKIMHD
jgi:hypothetical protein